jgi:hypothetical protein
MRVGDLVVRKCQPEKTLGIITLLYEIPFPLSTSKSLPVAEIMTESGPRMWKRRELEVVSESR